MFGRSEDIFEEEKTKEGRLTREEKKQERLKQKELKRQEKEDLKQQKAAFEAEMRNREEEKKRQAKLEKFRIFRISVINEILHLILEVDGVSIHLWA